MLNLSQKQKDLIFKNKIKLGNPMMLPRWGFNLSTTETGELSHQPNNPFINSLDYSNVQAIEIGKKRTLVRFCNPRPNEISFWIPNEELEKRDWTFFIPIAIILVPIFYLYNLFTKKINKNT